MADEIAVFKLEEGGRLADPKAIASFLSDNDGTPVQIDASNAPLITSLMLQTLVAGERHWKANELDFEVINSAGCGVATDQVAKLIVKRQIHTKLRHLLRAGVLNGIFDLDIVPVDADR